MRRKILIIDDDSMLRSLMRSAFKDAGFEVTAADSFAGARQALLTPGRKYDAVLTDGQYPGIAPYEGMGSLNLLTFLKQERPDLCPPVVTMITGAPDLMRREIAALGESCVRPEIVTKGDSLIDLAEKMGLRLG